MPQDNSHILRDYHQAGAPLIISFSFAEKDAVPPFDFRRCLGAIEDHTGQKFNKLFLRDPSNRWYQFGVPGYADSAAALIAALEEEIRRLSPSRVMTIGQSMGAYAAMYYGVMIEAERAVALGALSAIDPVWLGDIHDLRWMAHLKHLGDVPCPDLMKLPWGSSQMQVKLIYGSKPLEDDGEINLDAVHAGRLATLPRAELHLFRDSGHRIYHFLRADGSIDRRMQHWLGL